MLSKIFTSSSIIIIYFKFHAIIIFIKKTNLNFLWRIYDIHKRLIVNRYKQLKKQKQFYFYTIYISKTLSPSNYKVKIYT